MKTKIFLSSLLAVSLFMVSCKKELQPQESATPTETAVIDASAAQAPENAPQPVNIQPQPQAQPQPITTAPGMNPPHGQPNHRCDIAVGAPLNSPAGKGAQPAQAQAPVQQAPQVAPSNSTIIPSNSGGGAVAAGVNPPHGMPGHRCDIAVGAQLP